jgi:predicted O-linked N-acetylglucosamine transferase (SPINDLY family)
MKRSLRHGAGFLSIDHRDSPGLKPEQVAHVPGAVAVGAGKLFERDVLTCSHCERAVVLEPLRTRDRGHCSKCNRYVCDQCDAIRVKTGACVPFKHTLERMQTFAELGNPLQSHEGLPQPALALAVSSYQRLEETIRLAKAAYAEEDWDAAEPHFRALLEAGVSPAATHAALGTIALYQGRRADANAHIWKAVDAAPEAQDGYDNLVMYTDADPATTPQDAQNIRALWWEKCGEKRSIRPHENDRIPDRSLRVGYVSGDFCHHSAASVFGPFALSHTAAIEPYFYSSTEKADQITPLFASSPRWRDVVGLSDNHLGNLIRQDRIDILVDLSGYTANNRLAVFARKPAPIQVTGWGYGTGLGWPVGVIDYLIADATVIPERHQDITEQIAVLPCVLPYFPTGAPPTPSPLPCLTQPPLFGVFQRALKINDACLETWRLLLERLPESRLLIKGDYCRSFVERMQDILAPVLERVSIVNIPTTKADHLAMWQHIDVALDTWPQSGGVASCEALWHGVPMVTLQGDRLMSRVASSLLTNLGLTDYIASTLEEYVQAAAMAVAQPFRSELQTIRQELPARYAAWIAQMDYLHAVEDFYRRAWQTWCATP